MRRRHVWELLHSDRAPSRHAGTFTLCVSANRLHLYSGPSYVLKGLESRTGLFFLSRARARTLVPSGVSFFSCTTTYCPSSASLVSWAVGFRKTTSVMAASVFLACVLGSYASVRFPNTCRWNLNFFFERDTLMRVYRERNKNSFLPSWLGAYWEVHEKMISCRPSVAQNVLGSRYIHGSPSTTDHMCI